MQELTTQEWPKLGLGLGLRNVHFDFILANWPEVDWFEIISENFMFSAGRPRHILRQISERYRLVMHGVSMSIGSTDPIDFDYLRALKALAKEIEPCWISDHLCWTGYMGYNMHDLLPLPLTDEVLQHLIKRIDIVQDFLGRPLVLENPSSYIGYTQSTWSEANFLSELVDRTGCRLLFDVNNCYVSCFNSDQDPEAYLQALPHQAIVQLHVAGHQHCGTHIIDTHDRPVASEVWQLYRKAWSLTAGAATLLEWDGNIPAFEVCIAELYKARDYVQSQMMIVDQVSAVPASNSISTPLDFLMPPVIHELTQFASSEERA